MAWITRKKTSAGRFGASPQARDPRVNTRNPVVNTLPRPKYSDTLPKIRRRLVMVTR